MMIDLHTHLLPNVDDGAGSVEETIELLQLLSEQKVKIAVCTPHFYPYLTALSEFLEMRNTAFAMVSGVSNIRLITGSETMLHDYLFHYPDLSELCIAQTRYLLLEMPFTKSWGSKVYEGLNTLINYYKIIPIIAHIERYPAIRRNKRALRRLLDMGCLLQMNTSSLVNKQSRHRAIRLLKKDYISVLGSDCHNRSERPPRIALPLEIIRKKVGSTVVERMIHNAELIIQDEIIQ